MRIQLSDHFSYHKLLRFVLPSVIMMIFTSVYSVVDGLFISNFAGKTDFAAVNLIYPPFMLMGALGFMIGAGGTAVVARMLGMGEPEKANRYFSMLVYVTIIGGVIITVLGEIFLRPMAVFLGAEGEMLTDCLAYGRIIYAALPFFMLQNVFQSFFVSAEKPKLGLAVAVLAGCVNIVLDALLVGIFPFGIIGAAVATAISQAMGGLIPIIYFARKNDSLLSLGKTSFYGNVLLQTCLNGSSELASNASASFVTMLYNFQLMRYLGENGIAAYGVIGYVSFIFVAIFFGYAIGSAPVVSFHYGAGNTHELKNLRRKSIVLMSVIGFVMAVSSLLLSNVVANLFVGYDQLLHDITVDGLRIFSISFLLVGFPIFGSAFFTALGNGGVSALISVLRILVFQSLSVLILPLIMDVNGIWGSIVLAEFLAFCVTIFFLIRCRRRYHY